MPIQETKEQDIKRVFSNVRRCNGLVLETKLPSNAHLSSNLAEGSSGSQLWRKPWYEPGVEKGTCRGGR